MSSILLTDHPAYFFKIAALFEKSFNKYYLQNLKNINLADLELKYSKNKLSIIESADEELISEIRERTIQKSVTDHLKLHSLNRGNTSTISERSADFDDILNAAAKYEATRLGILKEFKKISYKYLIARDIDSTKHFDFFYQPREVQLRRNLQQDPLVKIIETVYDWTIFNKDKISDSSDFKIQQDTAVIIAIEPEIFYSDYKEIVLEELDHYIFKLLENAATLEYLLEELALCFNPDDIKSNYENFFQLIILKLKNLINNKCIRISDGLC